MAAKKPAAKKAVAKTPARKRPAKVDVSEPNEGAIHDPGSTLGAKSLNPDGITDPGTTLDS